MPLSLKSFAQRNGFFVTACTVPACPSLADFEALIAGVRLPEEAQTNQLPMSPHPYSI
jgi:hypothetical protein